MFQDDPLGDAVILAVTAAAIYLIVQFFRFYRIRLLPGAPVYVVNARELDAGAQERAMVQTAVTAQLVAEMKRLNDRAEAAEAALAAERAKGGAPPSAPG